MHVKQMYIKANAYSRFGKGAFGIIKHASNILGIITKSSKMFGIIVSDYKKRKRKAKKNSTTIHGRHNRQV